MGTSSSKGRFYLILALMIVALIAMLIGFARALIVNAEAATVECRTEAALIAELEEEQQLLAFRGLSDRDDNIQVLFFVSPQRGTWSIAFGVEGGLFCVPTTGHSFAFAPLKGERGA